MIVVNTMHKKLNHLGTIKSLFSFSTAKTEKNLWKKLEKEASLVVWWFDTIFEIHPNLVQFREKKIFIFKIKTNLNFSFFLDTIKGNHLPGKGS